MKTIDYSTSTFEKMIKSELLYVDKTEYLRKLITQKKDTGIYFLSRPRRFGKSLTVSTLKAIFQGEKELFKGLAIYDKYDYWGKTYPVIHLDLGSYTGNTPQKLEQALTDALVEVAREYKTELRGSSPSAQFVALIKDLSANSPVVILIDEYDKSIINNLNTPDVQGLISVLRDFFTAIKTCDYLLRFVFITGVSKFSHTSLFSGLNNLTDISMRPEYATMLGFTQLEFEKNYQEAIDATYESMNMTREELVIELKNWYNGFRFSPNAETVYSPVSVALFFDEKQGFLNYWSNTGNPSHVTEFVKQHKVDIDSIFSKTYGNDLLGTYDISNIDPVKILFHAGYLTIKSSEFSYGSYSSWLGFPNLEVGASFNICLLSCYNPNAEVDITNSAKRFKKALLDRNREVAIAEMNTYFAQFPYNAIKNKTSEYSFQIMFISFCVTYGIHPESEVATNHGRIDAVIRLEGRIFIFEFKLDNDQTALSTIKEKQYYQKYLYSTSEITLVGVNFSRKEAKAIKIVFEDIDKSHPLLTDGNNA